MKLSQNEARKRVYDAMLKSNGDRAEAAREMGVSIRTFWRYQKEYDLEGVFEKMGWRNPRGPVKGSTRGLGIVRIQILEYMGARPGLSTGELIKGLTVEIFGVDDRVGRVRVQSALELLRKGGKIELDEANGVWSLTGQ